MKKINYKNYYLVLLLTAAVMFTLLNASTSLAEDEETYSIDLVQTAEVAKEIVELGNKKVLTETYTAKEGDHIWQMLRKRDLLKSNKLGGILAALKKLNPSISNIDMIHPGEKIVIPLVITPISNGKLPDNIEDLETVFLDEIKDLEYYTVSKGDTLVKVINEKYSIPEEILYDEYLAQLRKLNPDLKDPDHILPGQKVRLPIYSPKIARGTVKKKNEIPEKDTSIQRPEAKEIGDHLSRIFTLIGEEWVQQGQHFIPLSGSQLKLKTETYPLLNLRNGKKIIVDLFDVLSEDYAELIKSNWENYQIVHITEKDDLESSLAKILPACNYASVYAKDKSLGFEAGIKIDITVDWIITLSSEPTDIKDNIICLNMNNDKSETVPSPLKEFLVSHNVKIIDYPPDPGNKTDTPPAFNPIGIDDSRNSIIEKILELTGQKFSAREDLSLFQGKDSDLNLIVKADYFFKRNGKDCIIDMNGLSPDIINILKENRYRILPLSGEPDIHKLIGKTLDFMGVKNNRDNTFYAFPKNKTKNIKIIVPGILFKGPEGQSYLISFIDLTADIVRFLSMKVDKIFIIKTSLKAE